ncbi:DNA internalization-related competence protein ComEC/Rec2 [Alkalimonas sp. MEB108]|uniref:DNA internalization-related competence protein ComEC/Rec2 n=1 Tax=Alkalimonas cellulosilytica TaxID=3058395 RepID=A0ABU7J4P0_9GAMM|nr:DNA internalization-related competence protein ComEC/Rec2 [Alkalimonas sp. MEB108]MEE2001464.1 DNA internalization-related competence protein ComEC/Rec2 [Alkalimonas sp. MEB108]
MSLFLPAVPPFFVLWLLLASVAFFSWRRCWFCVGLALYFLSWHSALLHHQQAMTALLQTPVSTLEGRITSIPKQYERSSQFEFTLLQGPAAGYKVQVHWFQPKESLYAGQVWQLPVQLSALRDQASRDGFSAERQALVQQQLARASVRSDQPAVLLGNQPLLRQRAYMVMQQATESLPSQSLLLALTLGERQFTSNEWQGLRHASLGHLLAISGLHIGLVFGWCCYLLLPLRLLGLPAHWQLRLKLLLAFAAAALYAWLAGFAIPTVRALLGLSLLVVYSWHWQRLSYHRFWLLLVALLLLIQPLWGLTAGFWLSVGAVGLIFIFLWRFPARDSRWWSKLQRLLGFHLFITLCMMPFTLLFFGGVSWLALLSNLLFVPWCSLVAIPALLVTACLQALLPAWAAVLWPWVDRLFTPLRWWLELAASQQGFWWRLPELPWVLVAMVAVSLLLLLLVRKPLMLLFAALSCLPLGGLLVQQPDWRLHLLDVGQGQAVLLQYRQHGLLYNAGPAWAHGSATEQLVLPYLQQAGVKELHYLVLSHSQADVLGSWPVLRQHYPALHVVTDVPTAHASRPCTQMPQQFFQAELVVLQDKSLAGNMLYPSCVLWLDVAGWRILLPGAMQPADEARLLHAYPKLQADIVLLAQSGHSRSTSLDYLQQLQPKLALSSHAHSNRVQRPAALIQARLKALQIPLLSTAEHGTIQIAIGPDSVQIYSKRARRLPFWLDSM